LLHVCLSHGLDLPYFCWHPALGSVGACRQCAVTQFANPDDKTGRIVMACMTPAADGTRISLATPEATAFRASVIEWMMTNHPHDCPVCEEGGECHLQDMTVMTGHTYRRYRFTKRTHRNQYLGPFIKHEMNRCIACYRCVRFYRDYAGGQDLDVQGAHNNVYFGRDADGVLENDFSGNLVEVCPTGVFTDKTLSQAYNRKWDLRSVPSVCMHCGVGCNTNVSERAGKVRRILNRFNGSVNGYFLCDRGRFGYGFANGPDRLTLPVLRERGGATRPASKPEALEQLARQLRAGGKVIGIGSPRASLEANFALRTLVGADAFYAGLSTTEAACLAAIRDTLQAGSVRTPNLQEVEAADAVLVLGEDVSNTAPRLALALRQAVRTRAQDIAEHLKFAPWQDAAIRSAAQDIRGPLFIASPAATRLDDIAAGLYRAAPDDITRLGFAIRHHLDATAPAVDDLPEAAQTLAARIADALRAARRPLIVAGCQLGEAMLRVAVSIAQALDREDRTPALAMAVPECNSLGLALLQSGSVHDAIAAAKAASHATVIILENDLYRRAPPEAVDALFDLPASIVVLDHVATNTTAKADIVLPCAGFAECEATWVSGEGRAQRTFQAVYPKRDIPASWSWLCEIAAAAGRSHAASWQRFDDISRALAAELPAFTALGDAAPAGDFRITGSRIRSEPHRYSGRTAIDASRTVQEPKAAVDNGSPFSSTMEGYYGQMPSALIPFFWAPGWNSGQSLHKFQDEAGIALNGGNPGVRLFEPHSGTAPPEPLAVMPPAFTPGAGRWLVVPRAQLFGSEELSARAPAVQELIAPATLFLNADDAASLGVQNGGLLEIAFTAGRLRLPVTLAPELPSGVAAISAGLPATAGFALPGWASLLRPAVEDAGPCG
jgi:NADH-quinone oxidoreductase subunit G